MKECLFHSYSNNVAAYCRYHDAAMTVKQMKCKNCLDKQCKHLVKNENHSYWKQREVVKQKRKLRKQMIDNYVATVQGGM